MGWQEAINRWPTVRFQFVARNFSSGIDILGYEDLGNICGLSSFTYDSAGKMERCKVEINILHNEMNCGLVTDTLTHEIGHCIGVFKHTRDGGLMDEKASGSGDITSAVTDMVSLLYSLAPGTDISDKLIARRPGKTRGKSRYQPDGSTHYSGGLSVFPDMLNAPYIRRIRIQLGDWKSTERTGTCCDFRNTWTISRTLTNVSY